MPESGSRAVERREEVLQHALVRLDLVGLAPARHEARLLVERRIHQPRRVAEFTGQRRARGGVAQVDRTVTHTRNRSGRAARERRDAEAPCREVRRGGGADQPGRARDDDVLGHRRSLVRCARTVA